MTTTLTTQSLDAATGSLARVYRCESDSVFTREQRVQIVNRALGLKPWSPEPEPSLERAFWEWIISRSDSPRRRKK